MRVGRGSVGKPAIVAGRRLGTRENARAATHPLLEYTLGEDGIHMAVRGPFAMEQRAELLLP